MNVNFEQSNNVNGVITITIGEADYAEKVKKNLKQIGLKHPVKGFRPGHTPIGILSKLYGKQVLADVVNDEIGEQLTNYIHENKLQVLGEPILSEDSNFDMDNSKEFTFKFNVGLAPEFDVDLSQVEIPYYNIEVDDEMFENQSKSMRMRFGKREDVEETTPEALIAGSLVELNEDGSVKEGGITVEHTYVSPRFFKSEDEKAKFAGKKLNEEVVFNPWNTCEGNLGELGGMLNVKREEADVKSDFKMTITTISVDKEAELNQEFFDQAFGKDVVKSEEEYVAKVKESIKASLVGDSNYRFTVDAQNAIVNHIGNIELPDEFLKKFFVMKDEKATAEKMEEDYPKMRPQLIWQLAKDKIAANGAVKVQEEDLLNIAKLIVTQQFSQYGIYNAPADAVERQAKEIVKNAEYRRDLANRAVDDKVFAYIRATAKIVEKEVPVKEFNALFEAAE